MLGLERLELAEETVVLGVRDLGRLACPERAGKLPGKFGFMCCQSIPNRWQVFQALQEWEQVNQGSRDPAAASSR